MAVRSREAYGEKIERQLLACDAEIEHFKARADLILARLEERYYALLKSLRLKEKEIRDNLARLMSGGDCEEGLSSWQEQVGCLESARAELRRALNEAARELDDVKYNIAGTKEVAIP